jgi:hypothetical protein
MAKLFAAAVVAIVLLTAGALVLVNRLTEPVAPGPAGAERAEAPSAGPSDLPSAPEPGDASFAADRGAGAAAEPAPEPHAPLTSPLASPERQEALGKVREQWLEHQQQRRAQRHRGAPSADGNPAAPPDPDE